jgi:hypothetical protein
MLQTADAEWRPEQSQVNGSIEIEIGIGIGIGIEIAIEVPYLFDFG